MSTYYTRDQVDDDGRLLPPPEDETKESDQ